jgi:hypothetical protein
LCKGSNRYLETRNRGADSGELCGHFFATARSLAASPFALRHTYGIIRDEISQTWHIIDWYLKRSSGPARREADAKSLDAAFLTLKG